MLLQVFCHEIGKFFFRAAASDIDGQTVLLGNLVEHVIERRHIFDFLARDARGAVDEQVLVVVVCGNDALYEADESFFARRP